MSSRWIANAGADGIGGLDEPGDHACAMRADRVDDGALGSHSTRAMNASEPFVQLDEQAVAGDLHPPSRSPTRLKMSSAVLRLVSPSTRRRGLSPTLASVSDISRATQAGNPVGSPRRSAPSGGGDANLRGVERGREPLARLRQLVGEPEARGLQIFGDAAMGVGDVDVACTPSLRPATSACC